MIRFKYKIKGGEKMKNLFIEYPKCSTCQKAKKWLDENKIEYVDRNKRQQKRN